MNSVQFFQAQQRILEEVLPPSWFLEARDRKANHPAYRNWSLCNKLSEQNGIIKWPEDRERLPDIAAIILDNCFLIQCSGGDLSHFRLGAFANYGDQRVKKRLFSVIVAEDQFHSLMTQLSYAAWHLSKGHTVTAYEDPGFPDFRVDAGDLPLPLVIDCKRIQKDTEDSRFSKVIKKANSQIKMLNVECFGVAAIDISEKVKNPSEFSEAIPDTVGRISEIVADAIRSSNSAVSAVLLLWNDFVLHGEPGRSSRSLFAYRRRSHLIRHVKPLREIPERVNLFDFGNTIGFTVNWSPR